jgi:hypothetical protein
VYLTSLELQLAHGTTVLSDYQQREYREFSLANQKAFETQALAPLDVISTSALLYGFWGERYGNHFARVDFLSSLWYIGGCIILILVLFGMFLAWKNTGKKVTLALGSIALISLILGIGIASPLTAPITNFL